MGFFKNWIAKTSSKILLAVFVLVALLLALLGTIAEWTIEKYDEKWLGRRIELRKIQINPFTGSIWIHDLNLFEENKVDTFFHVKRIYTNLEIAHFISGDYDITELGLDQPKLAIIQSGDSFNFSDIVQRFSSTDTVIQKEESEPAHYRLENIHIDSGRFRYLDKTINADFLLEKLSARTPLIAWNQPNHHYEAETLIKPSGSINAIFDLNIDSLGYKLKSNLTEIDIALLKPYLTEVIKIGEFKGKTSSDLLVSGNFNFPDKIALHGKYQLKELLVTDPQSDTLAMTKEFFVRIDSINTLTNIFKFEKFKSATSFLKFELYPDGDNFSRLIAMAPDSTSSKNASSDSTSIQIDYTNPFKVLAFYVQDIAKNYVNQPYSIDTVSITNATLVYNDFTLHENFQLRLDSLSARANNLNSENNHLQFLLSSYINDSGKMDATLQVDPHDLMNIELKYSMEKLRISSFSPYTKYYVAHPFNDGQISYTSETKILKRQISSKNILKVKKIEVGKRIQNETAYKLPIKLAVAILKDKNGDIELEVPVSGNLDDPKYKLGKVIWGIIKNLLIKIAASPFKLLASAVGANEDDLKAVKFEYLSDSLTKKQQKSLSILSKVIKSKPELKIELIYRPAAQDELEQLALFEAKKRYLMKIDTIEEKDPTSEQVKQIESLSMNDSSFVNYLNKRLLFEGSTTTVIEKCKRYVGKIRLASRMNAIIANRRKLISEYLIEKQQLKPTAFSITDSKDKSDGIPQFEVKFGVEE
ncbi:MAG: DUF748 domain-containing protein [Cyclobacteriaceae bacterium]